DIGEGDGTGLGDELGAIGSRARSLDDLDAWSDDIDHGVVRVRNVHVWLLAGVTGRRRDVRSVGRDGQGLAAGRRSAHGKGADRADLEVVGRAGGPVVVSDDEVQEAELAGVRDRVVVGNVVREGLGRVRRTVRGRTGSLDDLDARDEQLDLGVVGVADATAGLRLPARRDHVEHARMAVDRGVLIVSDGEQLRALEDPALARLEAVVRVRVTDVVTAARHGRNR